MSKRPSPYLCGDAFERFCGNSLALNDIHLDFSIAPSRKEVNTEWFFVKIDYLRLFKEKFMPSTPFYLVTGKSDYCVDRTLFDFIDNENLIAWYSTNVSYVHEKLFSIPLGINNEWWFYKYGKDFADHGIVSEVIAMDLPKDNLVYANFNVNNNKAERLVCLERAGVQMSGSGLASKGFRPYLIELKRSFFCLAPNGNGIDTHRLWESLYVGTIPIVTRTINSVQYEGKLPIIFLDSWDQLKMEDLTEDLYHATIEGFDFTTYKTADFLQGGI